MWFSAVYGLSAGSGPRGFDCSCRDERSPGLGALRKQTRPSRESGISGGHHVSSERTAT